MTLALMVLTSIHTLIRVKKIKITSGALRWNTQLFILVKPEPNAKALCAFDKEGQHNLTMRLLPTFFIFASCAIKV